MAAFNQTQMKAVQVITKELRNLGWRYVYSTASGIMLKNGCVFVMYGATMLEAIFTNTDEAIAPSAVFMLNPSGASWHLETEGYLLAKGTISNEISSIYDYGLSEVGKCTLDKITTQVDKLVQLNSLELSKYKQEEVEIESFHTTIGGLPSSNSVLTTRYFMADVQNDPEIEMLLDKEIVYVLKNYINNHFEIHTLNKNMVDVSTKAILTLRKEELFSLIKIGSIRAIEIGPVKQKTVTRVWQTASSNMVQELPDSLKIFGLNRAQLSILGKAYMERLNYTPLLESTHSKEEMEVIYNMLKKTRNVNCLCNREFSMESLKVLEGVVCNGYDIDCLCENSMNADYLKQRFSDLIARVDEIAKSLHNQGYPTEAATVILEQAFRQKSYAHLLHPEYSSLQLRVIDAVNNGISPLAGKYLIENGISSEHLLYCTWSSVSLEAKRELRKMFYAESLEFKGEIWGAWLDKLFQSAMYLVFGKEIGLGIRGTEFTFCVDDNSIVIFDLMNKPVWRALHVNQSYLKGGIHESDICL